MYKNPHGYNWIHTQSTSRSLQTQLIRNLKVDDHIQTTSRIGWGWGRAGVFHQVRSLHFSSRFVVFLVTSREAGESFFQDLGLIQVGWESIDYPTCLLGNPSEMECAHQKRLWFIIEVSKNDGYTCTCIHLWLAFFLLIKTKNKELFWPDGFYKNVNNHLIINRLSFLQVFQGLGSKLGFRSWLLKKKYKNFNQMDLKLIKIRG